MGFDFRLFGRVYRWGREFGDKIMEKMGVWVMLWVEMQ